MNLRMMLFDFPGNFPVIRLPTRQPVGKARTRQSLLRYPGPISHTENSPIRSSAARAITPMTMKAEINQQSANRSATIAGDAGGERLVPVVT